ncbi:MAG: signal peptidase I [Clostridiales bacterium]|nr:signal peptidase I [Clostridiales bacterium]MDY4172157.1 signal peptidase I [Evtepia sp.]
MSQDHIPSQEQQPLEPIPSPDEMPPSQETDAQESETQDAANDGQEAKEEEKKKRPGAFGADLFAWLQALTFALVLLLVVFTFFGRLIGVNGHSMDPTLNHQDMLFLQSIAYEPKQGDVVVLHKDFGDITYPIVKRVIAVGGQTVEINYNTSTVYVDGQPLDEPYILEPMVPPDGVYNQSTYWEVPEGSIFVMGDNRNNSSDSRDSRLGPVDEDYVLGRAICTVLPFQHISLVK